MLMEKNRIQHQVEFLKIQLSQNESLGRNMTTLIIDQNKQNKFPSNSDSSEKQVIFKLELELKSQRLLIDNMEKEANESRIKLVETEIQLQSLSLQLQHAQEAAAANFFDKAAVEMQASVLENHIADMLASDHEDCPMTLVRRKSYSMSRSKSASFDENEGSKNNKLLSSPIQQSITTSPKINNLKTFSIHECDENDQHEKVLNDKNKQESIQSTLRQLKLMLNKPDGLNTSDLQVHVLELEKLLM